MNQAESPDKQAPTLTLAYTRELAVGAMCLALAVVVPVLFHALGGGMAGRTFLPMFLPILLAGLLTRPGVAVVVGVVAPFLSSVITGMPPLVPTAPLMAVELGVLAGVASLLRRGLGWNVWVAAVVAVVAGRAVVVLEAALLGSSLLHLKLPWLAYAGATLAAGLPGTILLLAVIPALALAVERASRFGPQGGQAR